MQHPSADQRLATVTELVELFFDLCAATPIDLFVEAGAKEASASRRASTDLGIERVVAFEANPYTHARFASVLGPTDVDYVHLALAQRDAPATFLVRRRADGSPIPDGQGSLLRRPGHDAGYESVTVDGVRLDSFFSESSHDHVAMWVDVEGAVDQVFGGATRLLSACDFVLVEVEARTTWDGQEWIDVDVEEAMIGAGLRPVARDAQARFQYNVLFARARALERPAVAARLAQWTD